MQTDPISDVMRTARRRPLFCDGPNTQRVLFGRSIIERILPHREPFLFVDEICAVDLSQRAVRGRRQVASDDPVFAGHFPGQPVYPAVLQVEAIGQLGLCAAYFARHRSVVVESETRPTHCRALRMHYGAFLTEVLPGDRLTLLAKLLDVDELTALCVGQVIKCDQAGNQTICSVAAVEVYFVED